MNEQIILVYIACCSLTLHILAPKGISGHYVPVLIYTPRIISYRQGDPYLLLRTQPDARQQIQTYTARPLHINYPYTARI